MTLYDPSLDVRTARQRYFDRAGFRDGGYQDRWVRLRLGPITLAFPNTKARVRSVRLHDIHHVLTEYETNWRGEAEIGAWEIASGCGWHLVAWALNLGAFAIGLLIAPRRTYTAFVRGRHSRNLYAARTLDEALLDRTVGELRHDLDIDRPAALRPRDRAAFVFWAVVAALASVAPYVAIAAVGVWVVTCVRR